MRKNPFIGHVVIIDRHPMMNNPPKSIKDMLEPPVWKESTLVRIRGRHYATGERVEIVAQGGVIRSVGQPTKEPADAEAEWLAPALFDLQINGCDGHSFNSDQLSVESVRHVVQVCRKHGIGAFCPTLVTNSLAALAHGMATIGKACETEREIAHAIPAIHLEGPYISSEDGPRGAHPREHIRQPNWDEFQLLQNAAGGRIRLVTLAPELDGALGFIERLVKTNVVVSLGHTAASPFRIREAVSAGARLSTHLGNGCHAMLPRHDNYLWEQLAADELLASIICDSHHLPPALIRCILRVKTPARVILTCDAGSLAGLPPGRYREWDQELGVLSEGKIVVADTGFLAGSWSFTDRCIGQVVRHGGVMLREAIEMATVRPRQLLGLPVNSLEVGQPADLVLFDWDEGGDFQPRDIVIAGKSWITSQCKID
jgi:N-acetylglucosamine-6-phosphate deacetylase